MEKSRHLEVGVSIGLDWVGLSTKANIYGFNLNPIHLLI